MSGLERHPGFHLVEPVHTPADTPALETKHARKKDSALGKNKKEIRNNKVASFLYYKLLHKLREHHENLSESDKNRIERAMQAMEGMPNRKIRHSLNVGMRAMKVYGEMDILIAGLLHDVPERLPNSYNKIKPELSEEVQNIVGALAMEEKGPETEVDPDPLHHMREILPTLEMHIKNQVILLKLCDRLDNLKKRAEKKIPKGYAQKSEELFKYLASQYQHEGEFDEQNLLKLGEKLAELIGCKNYLKKQLKDILFEEDERKSSFA